LCCPFEVFGPGRSKALIEAWTLFKDYFKIFDPNGYDFTIQVCGTRCAPLSGARWA
jgi:hypothetical protein